MFHVEHRALHISKQPDLKEAVEFQGLEYRHFDYTAFYEEDNLLGMWRRIFLVCHDYKPGLILLQFEHEECVNDRELAHLKTIGLTLQIYGKNYTT